MTHRLRKQEKQPAFPGAGPAFQEAGWRAGQTKGAAGGRGSQKAGAGKALPQGKAGC
ncbi:MAG: hypothetical protein LBD37_02510 [Treponema sp.]|nr:hypothetical protein [Treponema sp.]